MKTFPLSTPLFRASLKAMAILALMLFAFGIGKPASITAQDPGMKTYVWEHYSIGFSIPSIMGVRTNSPDEFTAGGNDFVMSILPWNDRTITDPHAVARAAYMLTAGENKRLVKEYPLDNLNGLQGYVAYITAEQNGRMTHNYVAGFINLSSSANFTVHVTWYDCELNDAYSQIAVSILNSFQALK